MGLVVVSYLAVRTLVHILCCLLASAVLSAATAAEYAEPHFTLTLRRSPADKEVVVASSTATAKTEAETGGVCRIEWKFAPGAPVESAAATVRCSGDETRYRLQVKVADGWYLEKRRLPEIACPLVGANGQKRWFMAANNGDGYGCSESYQYCSNGNGAGAFVATWDDSDGLYFGVEDASDENRVLEFCDEPGGRVFCEEVLGWRTGMVCADCDIVVKKVRRDAHPLVWSDFCDIYRKWGDRQSWSGKPIAERADMPEWLKSGAAMTRFSRGWLEAPARLERHLKWWRRTFGDQPVLAAIWGWEKVGTWYSPDYFPCHPDDATFSKCIALMKKHGFHPFAWPSGLNWSETIGDIGGGRFRWDGREKWVKPNLSHLAKMRDGQYTRKAFWLENGSQTTLCGGDEWSLDWFVGVVRELAARGIEIIQIDQYGGGQMPECWNPAHGHELGNGKWQIGASRRLLEKVSAVEGVSAVCTELRCERLNEIVAIQDIRDMEGGGDCLADVWGYLHHDKVIQFQSNPRRQDLWQLAHMAAEGQMPFFEPQYENAMTSRSALKNGDFEEGTDNARGPECWDRRPFYGGYLKGVDLTKPAWGVRGWTHSGWLGIAVFWEKEDVRSGMRAVRVNHDSDGWLDHGKPIQLAQTVEGLARGRYTVSCWVKSENDLAEFKLGSANGEIASVKLPSDGNWTRLELSADVEGDLTVLFFVKFGAKFLLDDIRLTRDGREVVQSGETRWIDFYRRWISLYCKHASKFLVRGRRIRAPEIQCSKIRLGGEGREVDAVCVAAYRADDGEEVAVLANATWCEQTVETTWGGIRKSIVVPPGGIVLVDRKVNVK